MGWDVEIVRVKPGAMKELPCPGTLIKDDMFLQDVTSAEVVDWVLRVPGVRKNGPDTGCYVWIGVEREGLMELSADANSVFVGHAKLEPLLALHSVLEAARPGWLLLDLGTCTLHDPTSLRAWHGQRLAQAEALRELLPK
jgi:hypothetical protein